MLSNHYIKNIVNCKLTFLTIDESLFQKKTTSNKILRWRWLSVSYDARSCLSCIRLGHLRPRLPFLGLALFAEGLLWGLKNLYNQVRVPILVEKTLIRDAQHVCLYAIPP